ncbi:MFS transporter, partial [Mesorhizobium sp. M0051]|uniref:MFS transporter n=1 Tax=Mesorhizobium sp. M0051 TaxID=2956862 RepID=UPI00333BF68E
VQKFLLNSHAMILLSIIMASCTKFLTVPRAGARDWTLQRDLQKSTLWTETFRTPTWTDYLRLNHRLTVNDRDIGERLAALHMGDSPPRISLSIERSTSPAPGSQVQPVPFVSRP